MVEYLLSNSIKLEDSSKAFNLFYFILTNRSNENDLLVVQINDSISLKYDVRFSEFIYMSTILIYY